MADSTYSEMMYLVKREGFAVQQTLCSEDAAARARRWRWRTTSYALMRQDSRERESAAMGRNQTADVTLGYV